MLLFGPWLIETAVWLGAMTIISIWVTRIYLHSLVALRMGKVKDKHELKPVKTNGKLPFVTVMLATYNEENVIDRLLGAVTKIDYPNMEIIVADDSTHGEMLQRLEKWRRKSRIRVIHRESRMGFKAGALNNAMRYVSTKAKYLALFDADYLPDRDVLRKLTADFVTHDDIAAVQGYTKHTLNATANALTKSVRIAFASYCLVDIAARNKFNGFIPLAGSVFMIKKDVVDKIGGFNENSITEDWEISSRLAEEGYRTLFDENISVPAECPSTFRGLLKQQMRWAEGVMRDSKNNVLLMLKSRKTNPMKKFDYMFYGFGAFNGMMGSITYALSGYMLLISYGYLTAIGVDRSLIIGLGPIGTWALFIAPLYIPLSLFTSAAVGLHREGQLKQFPWAIYLFFVSILLSPFVAYAGLRGLLFQKGTWTRTPKTGKLSAEVTGR